MLRAIADSLISVLLAPSCAACGLSLEAPLAGPVCDGCWGRILPFTPPLCERCGDPLPSWRTLSIEQAHCPRCRRTRPAVSGIRAIGPYQGSLRDIIHALKYGGRRSVAPRLAAMMRVSGRDALRGADLAVPVPLHWRRRRSRGFNQAEELARGLGIPVRPVLRRTRRTPSQTDLPAARRHANVRGAFRLRRRARVNGLRVLLVDDVCTTGATLEACARTLLDAGALEVRAVTAARVATRRPAARPR